MARRAQSVQDLGMGVLAIRSTLVNWSTRFETLKTDCMSVGIASAAVPLRSVHSIGTYRRSAYYLHGKQ